MAIDLTHEVDPMSKSALLAVACLLLSRSDASLVLAVPGTLEGEPASPGANIASRPDLAPFVENRGQWPGGLRFMCRTEKTVAWIEDNGIALQLLDPAGEGLGSPGGVLVRFSFEDVIEGCAVEGIDRLPGIYNFFLGNDPAQWRTNIATYAGVRFRGVQPGIDLAFRPLPGGGFKYDVHVAPGADLARLVIRCDGMERLSLDKDGRLQLQTALGPVDHARGLSWQETPSGERRQVECWERLIGEKAFGFDVPDRDPSLPLVIDPGIVWSTYIGSSGGTVGDAAAGVATGLDGDVFVVGEASGPAFPMTPGAYQHPGNDTSDEDVFVARLSGVDGSLVYSSVIGGNRSQERALSVDVDAEGQATVAGFTISTDFPTTPGAFDSVRDSTNNAAFVLRLSPMGDQLLYSTYLEGTGLESSLANIVRVDRATGSAVVGGVAVSGFPTTSGAWDQSFNGPTDAFVTRLDPAGAALEWSTYFGGSGLDEIHGLALDAQGNVTITGETRSLDLPTTPGAFDTTLGAGQPSGSQVMRNAFVARLDVTGSNLLWSTYLGGYQSSMSDIGVSVAIDHTGGAYVCGIGSPSFPTTPGAFQSTADVVGGGFVARFAADGGLLNSTLIGGPGSEILGELALDGSGMPTVAGFGNAGFPTMPGSVSPTYNGGAWDSIVVRLDPSLSKLVYSTYVGGSQLDGASGMSMSPRGRATIVGQTNGLYPTTPGTHSPSYNGGQTDGFVTTLDLYLQGVEPHGEPTPACRGPLVANATEMPAAGAQDFALYCSGAPPSSTGLLVVGRLRQQRVTRIGAQVWIDLSQPVRILPVTTDADGYVEARWPLTSATPGAEFAAQFFVRTTPSCTGSGPLAASDAILVTVQ